MGVENVRTVIEQSLRGKAGAVLLNLVDKLLTQAEADPSCLSANLDKIRVSIELFVDDRLANYVLKRARVAAGLDAAP